MGENLAGPGTLFEPVSYTHLDVYKRQGLVPAKRPILVRELLSMTSGLVYPDPDPAGEYMREVFTRAGIRSQNGNSMTTAEVIDAIAEKPLAFQPGEQWRYGTGTDVMGRIIEVTAVSYTHLDVYKRQT